MKKVYFLFVLLVCVSSLTAQRNDEGWTILDPNNTDKVVYVSNSSGNDLNGLIYSLPSSEIGSDPFLPTGNIVPFKTVEAAVSGVDSGEAVWVLLKRGDTFTGSLVPKSGKSLDKPFLYSSYGSSKEPPLLKTGAEPGIWHCCTTLEHLWIVGLSFYAHTRDPDSSEYVSDAGGRGIYLEAHTGRKLTNILLEGNVIRYYKDNVIQSYSGTGIVTDIKLRRNVILDGYHNEETGAKAVGLYVQNVNGFLLEENIFDHNGWLIPSYGTSNANDGTNGQATQFSHSTYFVDTQNVIFRNNSFNRPSSNGNKWVSTDLAKTNNITIENNLYNDCGIGISMGVNYRDGSYRFKDILINNNVFVNLGKSDLTRKGVSWGVDIDDWDVGYITNNIIAHQESVSKSGFGLRISGETRNLNIENNIFYDLKDSRGVLISDKGTYHNIGLTSNEFTYFDNFKRFIRIEKNGYSGFEFLANTYADANNILSPFVIYEKDYQFNEWVHNFGNEQAIVDIPNYPDATRDLDRYVSEVLLLPNTQAYYNELRNQTISNWRYEYTGEAIVNWIRNGFILNSNVDDIAPVANSSSLPDVKADCSLLSLDSPTATDNISGSIQGNTNHSFPILESTTLLWFYTDEAGNKSFQEQNVIIEDTKAPLLNVQDLPDLVGSCSILVDKIPTATDECSGILNATSNIEISNPLTESTTIIWSYRDSSDNIITQEQKIIITDNNLPQLNEPNLPDLVGSCSILVDEIPTASDECSGILKATSNIEISNPLTESTTIIWSYTDSSGNNITQDQKVIISDNDVPQINELNLPDLTGNCSLRVIDIPTANDVCDGTIQGVSDIDINESLEQSTIITWTYTDNAGNSVSQLQNIIITEGEEFSFDIQNLSDLSDNCSVLIIDIPTASSGCNGAVEGVADVDISQPFTESTTIVWTYTGTAGSAVSQSQKVIISDNEELIVNIQNLSDLTGSCAVTIVDIPTASAGCSGIVEGVADIDISQPITASTTIVWTYTDTTGNVISQSQNVIINEGEELVLNVENLSDLSDNCAVVVVNIPTASVGCNGAVQGVADVDISQPFTESTTIVWTYADATGSVISQSQNIIINDGEGLVLNVEELPDLASSCAVTIVDIPTASSGCNGTVAGVANIDISQPIAASTAIVWTYTDTKGNVTSQEQNIIITEDEEFIFNVENLSDLSANCSVRIVDIPTASTGCNSTIQGFADIDISQPITASTTIIWTFINATGNVISQPQNVVITEAEGFILNVQNLSDLSGNCAVTIVDFPTASTGCNETVQGFADVDISRPLTESTTIVWTYTSDSGSVISQSQNVVIFKSEEFDFNVENLSDLSGNCSVMIVDVPTANTGCNGTVKGIADVEINEPITESTTITWEYTNAFGERIYQLQKVVIVDSEAPIPNTTILTNINGICSIDNVDYPTANDACDNIIVGVPNIQFPIIDENVKEIVWTYVDSSNNSSSQIQKIKLTKTDECYTTISDNTEELFISDFEIEMAQETCIGETNASISVKALVPMSYMAKVNNTSGYEEVVSFNEIFNLSNLSSGDYTICLIATERDFELCQSISILSPKELRVNVKVDEKEKKMVLGLSGSSEYILTLNGVSGIVSGNEINLDLQVGDNELEVQAKSGCQNSFKKTISVSEFVNTGGVKNLLTVFPNPVRDGLLYVSIKDLDYIPYQFNVMSMSGSVIMKIDELNIHQDEIVIDVSELVQGTYIVQGITKEKNYSARFIKL